MARGLSWSSSAPRVRISMVGTKAAVMCRAVRLTRWSIRSAPETALPLESSALCLAVVPYVRRSGAGPGSARGPCGCLGIRKGCPRAPNLNRWGYDMSRKRVLVFKELPPDQLERLAREHEVITADPRVPEQRKLLDRKSTRLNSSH